MSHKFIKAAGTAMAMMISMALFGQSNFIEQSMKSGFFANEVSYVGNNQGLHYIWEQGPSNTQGLLVLDEALNLVDRLEFKLMHKKYSFAVKHLVLQGDEIRVFGVRKPQLKQVQQIGAQTIDLNTLSLKPDFAIVCEVPKTSAGGFLALAENNSYLLYFNASIQKTDGKVSDQFTFLDINGQVIRQDTIVQDINGFNVKRTVVFPAHDKSVALLKHLKPALSGESNSETDGFMRLTRYDFVSGRSDTLIMPKLDAPKKRYNTQVNYLGRGKLAFSGMYDLPDSIYHQGAYFCTLNISEQTGSPISYIPLDQGHASIGLFGNMLKNWEKRRKKGSAYRPFQTLVEVLEHPDNSQTFILERFKSSISHLTREPFSSSYNAFDQRIGSSSSDVYYRYSSLILVHVDAKGRLLWEQTIPKQQTSTNDRGKGSSYYAVAKGNGLKIYFNGLARNTNCLGTCEPEEAETRKALPLIQVSIDESGNLERTVLSETEHNVPFHVRNSFQDQDGRIIMLGRLLKKRAFRVIDP